MAKPTDATSEPGLASSALALLACAATSAGLDLLYTTSRGDLGPPGYPLLVTGLTLGAAGLVALCAGRLAPAWVLASWAGFETLAALASAPALALALAVIAAAGVLWAARGATLARHPLEVGAAVGGALFLALVVVPDAAGSGALPEAVRPLPRWLAIGAGLALAIGALVPLLHSPRRFGGLGVAPLASLGLSLAVVLAGHADALVLEARASFPAPPTATGPNVLVLVLDTVRADHLSLYGYERETTPQLTRRLANEARIYEWAYSPSNWTLPAHVSLFTGLLPSAHQVHFANGIGRDFEGWSVALEETLAERLAGRGYRTACVTANPYLLLLEGAGKGFDVWRQARAPVSLHGIGELLRATGLPRAHAGRAAAIPRAASVNASLLGLLEDCGSGGCFVVANYMEAHTPYLPSPPYAEAFGPARAPTHVALDDPPQRAARAVEAYDEEILELDAELATLLDTLADRGLLDGMWLFITSDHGESFGEHGSVRHATNIYDEQVRIPLIVRPPRGVPLPPDASPVSLLDVTATISAIATGEPLGVGRDLRDDDDASPARIEFFGWTGRGEKLGAHAGLPSRAVVHGREKLLELGGRRELYDLGADPREQRDLASTAPDRVERLARELPPLEVRSSRILLGRDGPDPETVEALRALGYVE